MVSSLRLLTNMVRELMVEGGSTICIRVSEGLLKFLYLLTKC